MVAASHHPPDTPPLWLLLALLAMGALHRSVPLATWLHRPWTRLGFAVIAAAVLLAVLGALRFRRAGTGIRPFRPAAALVVHGPYRLTRNPMYLGLLGVSVGVAICLGTVSPLCVPPLLFWVLDGRFVRTEEMFLHSQFGVKFDEYRQAVRRWL
jgi:protein-S-isoprenylcysteine O-methyltransferase Ste14